MADFAHWAWKTKRSLIGLLISPTLSKRSASCAILVFGVLGLIVGGDRDEQVPTAQLAGSNP